LGEQAKSEGDLPSAVVEYAAAVHFKDIPELHNQIAQLYRQLDQLDKAAAEEKLAGAGK
jgi:hypothetical protein